MTSKVYGKQVSVAHGGDTQAWIDYRSTAAHGAHQQVPMAQQKFVLQVLDSVLQQTHTTTHR